MTFSIVGVMGDRIGVAVASKFLAVGAVVPAAVSGIGGVATQAMAKVSFKDDALKLLAEGLSADDAVARVTAADAESAHRQLGVVAPHSQATFTGAECMHWAGGVAGQDDTSRYAIQGNILTGPEVVEAMERAWLANPEKRLPERLLAALTAGDEAGGDSRGRQSAAVYAVEPGSGYDASGVLIDLRVDDHPDAPTELVRLAGLHEMTFGAAEDVEPLTGELADEVSRRLASRGYSGGAAEALAEWAGVENYEMRLSPDGIDVKLLAALRGATDE